MKTKTRILMVDDNLALRTGVLQNVEYTLLCK
jgi:hypothetical protein